MERKIHFRDSKIHTEFGKRNKEFSGEFNDARSLRAYRSYRRLCDQPPLETSAAEKVYGERFDTSYTLRRGKVTKVEEPEIIDQEVPFMCESYEEAVSRVIELVGPVPINTRNFHVARLDENILKALEYCGFSAHLNIGIRAGTDIAWRLDYDPKKLSHFNVNVKPPNNGIDINPLNIAFVFPYEEGKFLDIAEATCRQVAINSFTKPDETTNYLPRTMGEVQRIININPL